MEYDDPGLTEQEFAMALTRLLVLANRNDLPFDRAWTVTTPGETSDLMVEITYVSPDRSE